MNKLLYSIMVASLLLLFSSISYAAGGGTFTLGSSSSTYTTTVTLSSGVYANYIGSTTGYGIATVNNKGTTEYGLSSASSQIYYQGNQTNDTSPTPVTAGQSTWTSATWTAMGQ